MDIPSIRTSPPRARHPYPSGTLTSKKNAMHIPAMANIARNARLFGSLGFGIYGPIDNSTESIAPNSLIGDKNYFLHLVHLHLIDDQNQPHAAFLRVSKTWSTMPHAWASRAVMKWSRSSVRSTSS